MPVFGKLLPLSPEPDGGTGYTVWKTKKLLNTVDICNSRGNTAIALGKVHNAVDVLMRF